MTVAPGSAPPCASRTTPAIWPVLVCATAAAAADSSHATMKNGRRVNISTSDARPLNGSTP